MVANIVRDYNGQLANKSRRRITRWPRRARDFDRTPVPRAGNTIRPSRSRAITRSWPESEKGGAGLSPADQALKAQIDKMFEEAVDEVHRVKPAR
jgi:F0F1-type ATP synthase gamma subunit